MFAWSLPCLVSCLLLADARVHRRQFPDQDYQNYETTEAYTDFPDYDPYTYPYYEPRTFRASCGGPEQLETFITYDLGDTDTFGDYPNFIITSTDSNSTDYSGAEVNGTEPPSNRYYNNMNCTIQFSTGSQPVYISTGIDYLDVERNSQCVYDSLKFAGIKHCGTRNYTGYYNLVVPPYETFSVDFTTDSSVTASGFQLNVYSWPANNESTHWFPDVTQYAPDPFSYNVNYLERFQSDYRDNTLPENSGETYYTTERPWGNGDDRYASLREAIRRIQEAQWTLSSAINEVSYAASQLEGYQTSPPFYYK